MTQRLLRAAWPALFAVATFSYSGGASADVPPVDACTPAMSAGTACNNAGPNGDQAGVCTNTKCTKTLPDGDGGVTTMEYDCVLCMAGSAGTGGSGGSGTAGTGGSGTGGTGASGGAASTPPADSDDDSGCSLRPGAQQGGALMLTMLALGLGALAASRRRR